MAVFLVIALFGFHLWTSNPKARETGVLGGPSAYAAGPDASELNAAITARPAVNLEFGGGVSEGVLYDDPEGSLAGSAQGKGQSAGIFSARGGVITYAVKQGDTLSQIADDFGISVQTITAANPRIRANALQIGQELAILPVSGITYDVKGGETLEGIADLFGVSSAKIREHNVAVDFSPLREGTPLVIPGATSRAPSGGASRLPNLGNYFVAPTEGFNWGRLHNVNAVDIANSCGTPVVSGAEGLVVDVAEDGWNNGYGGFVLIEHPNETKTRYAHLNKATVGVGDYVKQSEQIGFMGNTGNVHGPTGCHLHFEVEGAQNPLAR